MRAIAIDTETTGLNLFHRDKPFAFSACDDQGQTYYLEFPVDVKTRQPKIGKTDHINRSKLHDFVNTIYEYDQWIFHNSKFDIRAFWSVGICLWGTMKKKGIELHDTLIASHIVNSADNHGLKPLALKYLDTLDDDEKDLKTAVSKAKVLAKHKGIELDAGIEQYYWLPRAFDPKNTACEKYGTQDAIRTMKLFLLFQKELAADKKKQAIYQREMSLVKTFYNMETCGLSIRKNTLVSERQRFTELQQTAERKLVSMVGKEDFNFASPKQLQEYLYGTLKLKPIKETKTGFSTDAATIIDLEKITKPGTKASSFLTALLQNRKASSACKYLDQYNELAIKEPQGWVLHPSINQTGTSTTRVSSSNPNAQNVSTKEEMPLRLCFGPPKGFFWYDNDYDNIEMRLLAKLSGEQRLIDLFKEGGSYHLLIAEILHGPKNQWKTLNRSDWKKSPEYKTTKNGNFARGYGAGKEVTDRTYGIDGAYERLKGEFKHWTAYNEHLINSAKKKGYVETEFGYPLQVDKRFAYTTALNYKIQGTAGCIIKTAMLDFDILKTIKPELAKIDLLLTVHDELIFQLPLKEKDNKQILTMIIDCMESPGRSIKIDTPVSVSIVDTSWDKPLSILKPA